MNAAKPEVWSTEQAVETGASRAAIWALLSDVVSWFRWDPGIRDIEVSGPFRRGTRFMVTRAGGGRWLTRLVEVTDQTGFVAETQVGDVRVFVDHRIEPLPEGRLRVVFELEAFGPGGEEVGRKLSAPFAEALRELAQLAERQEGGACLAQVSA
ncbi:SRPBCC family protein [Opitutus sp. ER46]|uniref:SRPBCC family protein n=1 Tax=Opitutus sp. ER46 TaxID=2161864 RepID=UPI000D31C038|nr:SRPBCC family protein [Opitutus sp. ER46]PTX90721.1 polyketide cyclase/dehydrase [Opitutus sp. ER46]